MAIGFRTPLVGKHSVADFHLRPLMVQAFEDCVDRINGEQKHYSSVFVNNIHLAPWLTTISVCVYMVIGTFKIKELGGTLTLGALLASINVFKEVGMETQEIYKEDEKSWDGP
jgi:hypothetical protein